ncbi:TPA: hypothetical protein QDB28_004023 [Burkholderia vietnamiensis]|nr:hypothetical protein [Burkholderia vietnamiensis]
MSFKALLERFETLQKSAPADGGADDDKIAAAAAASGDTANADGAAGSGDAGAGAGDGSGDGAGAGDGGGEGGGSGDELLGKSFTLQLEDGTELEAHDGTELVKSLVEQVGALQGHVDGLNTERDEMTKALSTACEVIEKQDSLLKSLSVKVDALSKQGRGRASVVTVTEKPATTQLTKSEPAGVTGEEFMAKAMQAFDSGKIVGRDVAIAEHAIAAGKEVPADIRSKVLS